MIPTTSTGCRLARRIGWLFIFPILAPSLLMLRWSNDKLSEKSQESLVLALAFPYISSSPISLFRHSSYFPLSSTQRPPQLQKSPLSLASCWLLKLPYEVNVSIHKETAHPGLFSSMAPLLFDYTPLFGEFSVLAHWGLKGTTLKSTSICNEDSPKEKTTQHIAQVSPETYLQTSGEP